MTAELPTRTASAPGERAPWFILLAGGVWLVYLQPAAAQVTGGSWPTGQRVVGGIALVAFVVLYLTTLPRMAPARRARTARQAGLEPPAGAAGDREMWWRAGGLLALSLLTALAFGGEWLTTAAFVAAVLAVWLDRPWAPRAVVALAAVCEAILLVRGTDGDESTFFWLAFAVLVAGFVSYGARRGGELEGALEAAREENARLAVVQERHRIARDLHDLLGHSLTVVAVRSQLAERLLERGQPERAAAEIAGVRAVAREALHEVRHVVDGPRRRPLAAELASAAAALDAAGVATTATAPDRSVPQEAEDAAAFVVREGTTNVLRHAAASACAIVVARDDDRVTVTVADDGPAAVAHRALTAEPDRPPPGDGAGHGLRGLAARVAALGGTLEIGPRPGGGTELRATIPVRPSPAAPAATAASAGIAGSAGPAGTGFSPGASTGGAAS